ncbi:Tn3 family transposase [Nodosilinea sp. LEGE 07088]|uniref:Tn3 family transposase n=1 Tax=Nodosilinea sp. LEGE 07088 TaxID=2777968 RepID=UPI001882E2EC|nr:Tn3 family transposase [Nodosilinea sp. LEGE 07088]MBE9140675.1 Tn3 family transposase [Nodosilinea sp. LEGE 07088]
MPVRFLTIEQQQRYGRYQDEPTALQLDRYFHLDDADRRLVRARRGDHNRLGFAVQLSTVRFLGTFLINPIEVPPNVVNYLAQQLEIASTSDLSAYLERETTRWEHADIIQRHYGYQDFSAQPEHWRFVRWLYARAWVGTEGPSVLFDIATAQLLEQKILLPGVSVLERLVATVRERVAQRIWTLLSRLPSDEQCQRLDAILKVDEDARQTVLDQLRRSPTRSSAPALVAALHRLKRIRAIGVSHLVLPTVPPSRLKVLSRAAFTSRAQTIERMPKARRIATLLAFVHDVEATAQDDALTVLELLTKELLSKSASQGKKERLRTLKDLDAAALTLSVACSILLAPEQDIGQLREAIFSQVSSVQLAAAVEQVESIARPPNDQYYPEILSRWRTVRLFLPTLLNTIDFQATQAGQSTLAAVAFLKAIEGKRQPVMMDAPLVIVSQGWLRWVCPTAGVIDRRAYTFCVLEQLMNGLRCRDLYVSPSVQWSNPQEKLLQGREWLAVRAQVCRTLNLAPKPDEKLTQLKQQLNDAYHRTAQNLPTNDAVQIIEAENGRQTLTISPLEKLEESENLRSLRAQVAALLPRVDLPEVLLEIHEKTGFLNAFTHAHEEGARADNVTTSLCAVLVALACNIGLRPLQRKDTPALTKHRLAWIQQHYIRAETLIESNACLVNVQKNVTLVQAWGGGEVASADGLRFVVPVKTLNAGPNPKYFSSGRGITYYNFVSDLFAGFHGLVVTGTLRDSLVVLVGLLEQRTGLRPRELMTDTAGYSDMVFGLFWLLGYQFSPRLADTGEARFWRLDPKADYGVLDGIARQKVKVHLIENLWDDMLRVAGSLKLGKVSALEIMRVLQKGGKPSTLGKAIGELGRIAKTLYLLNYIDDEAYRRRILTQLNRGEGRHSLARAVCHGNKGEIRQRYREGQEDQLNALGLVTNAVILWNTLYMDRALDHLRAQGLEIDPEDVARLSPLGYSHINMLGRYYFELAEALKEGGFRPLRNPDDPNEPFY